jgi:hypothetical protein
MGAFPTPDRGQYPAQGRPRQIDLARQPRLHEMRAVDPNGLGESVVVLHGDRLTLTDPFAGPDLPDNRQLDGLVISAQHLHLP